MPRRQDNRALATYEHGTKIYAPTAGEPRFRIITRDPASKRITLRVATKAEARTQGRPRARARALETMLASSTALPGREAPRPPVGQLADRYLASLGARSTRSVERREYLLRMWSGPFSRTMPSRRGHPPTPTRSSTAPDPLAPATVQNLGAAMRALVTYASRTGGSPAKPTPHVDGPLHAQARNTKARHRDSSHATSSPATSNAPPCSMPSPTTATRLGARHVAQVPQRPPLGRPSRGAADLAS